MVGFFAREKATLDEITNKTLARCFRAFNTVGLD